MNSGGRTAETEGQVTDDTIRIFKTYAENEVSLNQTGYMSVMDYGKKPTHLCASYDKFIPSLARLSDAVHGVGNGCKMVAEIGHDGTASPTLPGMKPTLLSPTGVEWGKRISPSGITFFGQEEGHVLTEKEIARFCSDMGQASRRLEEAGWDGINIYAAHYYLINCFLSPKTNLRTDKYGGSMYKRVEIVRECVQQIRANTKPGFAIIIKTTCDDGPMDDGTPEEINIETFPTLAKMFEDCGVDAIDISGFNPIRSNIDAPEDQSYYKEYAAVADVSIPVMLSGGNRNVELLEEIITKQEGKVDFYNFARPLLREPHLIKQWLDGGDAKSTCTNISLCFRAMYQPPNRPAYCVQLEREAQEREKSEKEARAFFDNYDGTLGA